ncbi:MAG: type I-U CRISPR-associated protein Csb2, partial [Rhodospirillales bacterium]|nr:type I-U CRISPR-associated protein Csb2 [Rhodospirillales bacterium]
MPRALLISVRFHDGRFHGRPEWPPSPARLFQALVAAAAKGGTLDKDDKAALAWLESLNPPVIAAPAARKTTGYANYVPNNDLDAKGGDFRRIAEIRAPKLIKPMLFDVGVPILYLWRFDDGEDHTERVRAIAERLYQFGRGVDMAYAVAEHLDGADIEAVLADYPGNLYRPDNAGYGSVLACPDKGSLKSLIARFEATGRRFAPLMEPSRKGKQAKVIGQTFSQPPKPRFRQVAYDSPPHHLLFELRRSDGDFSPWPFTDIVRLVETVRNGATRTLTDALSDQRALVERVLIGKNAGEADKASRIRILPLPSIGHEHADRAIRRLLVEVPPDCPLDDRDVAWAFTAWLPHDPATGELSDWQLVEIKADAGERFASMPGHYGIGGGEGFRMWRTVTPAALPQHASRRRIDPARIREEAKGGLERQAEERQAAAAVCQALRHAGIETPVAAIRVQREPFQAKGARAEAFSGASRFSKDRLWHLEIAFTRPRRGPLVVGDGRYFGLGIMAPDRHRLLRAAVFPIEGAAPPAGAYDEILAALRRALMAIDRDHDKEGRVSLLFSGHEPNGSPARDGAVHRHVFLAAATDDSGARLARLHVIRPDAVDRTRPLSRDDKARFESVVHALHELRAGRLGVLTLGHPAEPADGDPLFTPARVWESRTPYRPTRHAHRKQDLAAAVAQDLIAECEHRGLPRPTTEILRLTAGPNGGNVVALARLRFQFAVRGPILLGRDSHKGGGVFAAAK